MEARSAGPVLELGWPQVVGTTAGSRRAGRGRVIYKGPPSARLSAGPSVRDEYCRCPSDAAELLARQTEAVTEGSGDAHPFVCGVVLERRRGPFSEGSWSWPFGRLLIADDEFIAWCVGFGRFARRVAYADVRAVRVVTRRRYGKVRIQRRGAGDVVVVAFPRTYAAIGRALESTPVAVIAD